MLWYEFQEYNMVFLVKLCLSAREYTANAKTEVFVSICSTADLSANNTSTRDSMYSTVH